MKQPQSIQRKVSLALLGVTGIVLLISLFTFATYDLSSVRRELLRHLSVMSEMTADNCTAALQFDNRGDAMDVLDSTRFDPHIVVAVVYDKDGKPFAQYPTNFIGAPPRPMDQPRRTTPLTIEEQRPVMLVGAKIGTIYLKSDLTALYQRFLFYGVIMLLIVVGSLASTFAFSRRIQHQVTRPILSLAEVARAVSERRDYSVRATKRSEDELGLLTDAFNLMLTRIQEQTAELNESRARLSSVIGSAMDAIISVNEQQRITIFNAAAEKMFLCSAADALGQPLDKFIPNRFRKAHKQHVEQFGRTGVTSRTMGRLQPVSGLRTNGEEFPIEASISQAEIGGQKIYTVILRDITERKKAEEARGLLASIVESSEDAVISVTLDGKILSWNRGAEKLYQYTAREAVSQPVTIVIPPERLGEEREFLERVSRGQAIEHVETVRVRKDGSTVDVSVTISPVRDSEGRIIGASKTARDITEQKISEREIRRLNAELAKRAGDLEGRVQERTAELLAANRELEAFTYSVAHDLRAPLRHINAFAKILEEDFASKLPHEIREYLSRIRGSSRNLSRLVDDLLNLARVGRQELNYQSADLHSLIQQARTDLQSEAQGRDIEWRIQKKLPKIKCDPGLMRLVFVNLLSNAIKYTRPRAKAIIEIACDEQNGQTVFFVRDNGVGFNMHYADKLFGVFQRLHRQEEFEGTGVGLATVDRIIRKHGGRIWAYAEPDNGATFFFTLGPADKSSADKNFQEYTLETVANAEGV